MSLIHQSAPSFSSERVTLTDRIIRSGYKSAQRPTAPKQKSTSGNVQRTGATKQAKNVTTTSARMLQSPISLIRVFGFSGSTSTSKRIYHINRERVPQLRVGSSFGLGSPVNPPFIDHSIRTARLSTKLASMPPLRADGTRRV
jgi:hypothetical protein